MKQYPQNLVCFNTFNSDESWSLSTYEKFEGYTTWKDILAGNITPKKIIDEVKNSGL